MYIKICLSAIQLDLSSKNSLPYILSLKDDKIEIPNIIIEGSSHCIDNLLEVNRDNLAMKHIDLDLGWITFDLIDVDVDYTDKMYFDIDMDHSDKVYYINIIYGCIIPFGTIIKDVHWVKPDIDNLEQYPFVIKTLNKLGDIHI